MPSPAPRLIGIGGALRAGKDTAADHLVAARGFVKVQMSEVIDEALLLLDPIVEVATEIDARGHEVVVVRRYTELRERLDYTAAKQVPEVRALLQRLGFEVGRHLDEGLWVTATRRKVAGLLTAGTSVVVTGVRFPNDAAMVAELGGTLVWVTRPDTGATAAQAAHASENSLDPSRFDAVVVNDGTVADLAAHIDALL